MAKKAYIGVNGVARQIKKMYVGVGGVARKVKKAYIGVAGVARCFFGGGELSYYGTASDFSTARNKLAATTVGDYALFGGGNTSNNPTSPAATMAVSAYNSSITKTTMQSAFLHRTVYYLAATTVGNYALFGGGGYYSSNRTKSTSDVSAFNNELTRLSNSYFIKTSAHNLAATTVGNYALFGGGFSTGVVIGRVTAYDSSLTRTYPTDLSEERAELAATTVGDYALFGGGTATSNSWGARSTTVDAYDTSLTRTTPTALSLGRSVLSATANGSYAIFAGGRSGTAQSWSLSTSSKVDAYDTSLTQTSATDLSAERYGLMGASIGGYALFAGGYRLINNNGSYSYSCEATVDAYDTSLTRTIPTTMSEGKHEGAGTTVGNYALFGGGTKEMNSGGLEYVSKAVDVYTVS